MSCFTQVVIDGKPVVSKLQPKILEILKNNPHIVLEQYEEFDSINDLRENHFEEVAGQHFNYFESSDFIEDFGDWKNLDSNIDVDSIYENGEPRLIRDKNNKKYYYKDKHGDKVYFPLEQNGLNYIFSSEEIQEGTKVLAYELFKRSFNNDWNDLSFINDGKIKETLTNFISGRINELNEEEEEDAEYFTDRLRDSLYYIDEWTDNVKAYYQKLGFKIEQSDVEEQDGETDNARTYGVSAFEVSPSNSVSTNVWTFLSFLPNNDVDSVFIKTSFEDVNDVYQTLQKALSDLSPTIIGGQVEDLYETMLTKIGTLAHKKPYFKELLNILNNPSLSEDKKSQFTQAFNLVKNPFFVSEVDFKGKNIKHTTKDVSQVNANFNSIKREWGFNFETIFIEDGKLNTAKLVEIRDNLKVIRSDFDKLKKTINDNSELVQPINKILKVLHDMGAVTTEQGFNSYIGNLEDVVVTSDELISKTNDVLSIVELFNNKLLSTDTKTNIKVFNENGKFINPFNTQSLFADLAKEEAFYKPDGSDASIYSANKSYWIYSLPSYLAGEINKWKSNIEELESLYREPGNESSKVLEYILGYEQNRLEKVRLPIAKARIEAVKLGIFNVFQERKTDKNKSDPKNNTELAKDDAVLDSMNRILMSVKGENSLFNTPTPADKSTSYLLSHGYFLNTNVNEIVDKRAVLPSKVIQVFYDYFSSEYNRMIRATKDINDSNAKKYVHYHTNKRGETHKDGKVIGNAFKSQIFEGLSFENIKDVLPEIADRIYQDDGTPALDSINSYETEIKDYIHNILKDGIAEKVSFLTSKDIISPNSKTKGGYDSRGIDTSIMKAYEAYNYPVLNAVSDYYINGLISNIEYGKMFSGDSAYYKDMVDYAKRIPSTYTDGLQLRLQNADELTFNAAIVTGVEVSGKNVKDIEELAGKTIADMYKGDKVNTTDAQAWITPKRWEFLVKRLGLWTKYHETAYPKMLGTDKTAFTPKEIKAVAQPLKGVYYKRNNGVPTFLKYSQAVLLPDLIKGTDLQRVYDKMIENEIDETITLDGIKVGATVTDLVHNEDGTLADEFDLTPLQLDNRGWKLQQNLPIKGYKETDTGSQIQKNVLAGIANRLEEMFSLNNRLITGKELYSTINDVVGELSQRGVQDLSNELSIDKSGVIGNKSALYKLLLDEAKKRNINENLIKALEKELTIYGIPQSQSKLMNMFMSIVKDRLVKIKTNGGSFIQVSNFGIDTLTEGQETGVKWFIDPKTGLRPPHFAKDENGEYILNEAGNKIVKPGQVLLPGSLLTKYIPNWKDMDAADLKAMISPEILENIIGYRIPNQGLSSNDALEIVGFLPEGMGDAVVAYSEIPTKTGSDFDIDKMFMMIPSFSQDEEGNLVYAKPKLDEEGNELPLSEQPKEVLQNKLIESYKAVFLHPDVVKDVLTPIDFDYIKKDINSIFDDSGKKSDLYHFDVINQINIKYDFLAGKAGVGQTANMLVDHVRGMFTKNSLRDTYIGWGHKNEKNETLFDEEYSQELNTEDAKYISDKVGIPLKEVKKYKISNSISAFLNAFVDIAKDPYVTRGNWTTQTSNTGFMMLRSGMHPMYVNRFIGQPVIKEYIDFVVNAESKFNNEQGNIRELFKSHYIKKLNEVEPFYEENVQALTLKELDDEIKNYTFENQFAIINKFFELQDHSKTLVRGIKAAKPDTDGAGKDLSSRLIAQNIIEEIKSDELNKVEGSLTNFRDKLVDPTTKQLTILGHYVNNSVYWLDKVTKANPKLFQMANKHVENTINTISQQIRGTKLLNEKIADQLYKDYYTYSLSGFEGLKLKSSDKLLFIDLASELTNEKLENEDNYFLNQLEVIQEDGLNFIKLQNKKRSEGIQNKLYRGWKDLFEENPELATKLVKYSYYQSGFNSNINEFFTHIPHEYFVENKLNHYIYDLDMRTDGLQTKFIDQMYRHNYNNTLIVPNLPKKQVSVLKQDMSYIFDNKNMIELKLFAKVGDNLVKLEGYDANGNGIYVNTFKLGIEKNNGKIIEYKFDTDVVKSQLPANNPKNLDEINEYVKTLQIATLPGEFKSKNKKTKSVDNTLTETEVEFNNMFSEPNNIDYIKSPKNKFTVIPSQKVDKKAQSKAKIATQYIGFGDGIENSSTALYAKQAGEFANTGNYNSNDVIFTSIGGKRGSLNARKVAQDKTIREVIKAIEAGATIITDNQEYTDLSTYNEGEKRLKANLEHKNYNYSEITVDGNKLGVWSKDEVEFNEMFEENNSSEITILNQDKNIFKDGNAFFKKIGEPFLMKKETIKNYVYNDVIEYLNDIPVPKKFGTNIFQRKLYEIIDNRSIGALENLIKETKDLDIDFSSLDNDLIDLMKTSQAEFEIINSRVPETREEGERFKELLSYKNNLVAEILTILKNKYNLKDIPSPSNVKNDLRISNMQYLGVINEKGVLEDVRKKLDLSETTSDAKTDIPMPKYYEGFITPSPNTVFVFGSNPQGKHGAGAAKTAMTKFGAKYGQGRGLQGDAFAIPTKDLTKTRGTEQHRPTVNSPFIKTLKNYYKDNSFKDVLTDKNPVKRSVSVDEIISSISELYKEALKAPNKQFKVAFGEGLFGFTLNGYLHGELIEMFNAAGKIPSNVIFSKTWYDTGLLNITSDAKTQYQELVDEYSDDKPIVKPKVIKTKPVKIDINQLNLFSDDVNSKLDEFDNGCKK